MIRSHVVIGKLVGGKQAVLPTGKHRGQPKGVAGNFISRMSSSEKSALQRAVRRQ